MGLSSLLTLIIPLVTVIKGLPSPQATQEGYLRLQPEIDLIDIESYLKNERLVKLQLQCLLLDKPCDIVGRWLKPRVKAALLGECLVCTKKQQENYNIWLQKIIERFPDFYRAAVAKYVVDAGINISDDDKALINRTVTDDAIVNFAAEVKHVAPNQINMTSTDKSTLVRLS